MTNRMENTPQGRLLVKLRDPETDYTSGDRRLVVGHTSGMVKLRLRDGKGSFRLDGKFEGEKYAITLERFPRLEIKDDRFAKTDANLRALKRALDIAFIEADRLLDLAAKGINPKDVRAQAKRSAVTYGQALDCYWQERFGGDDPTKGAITKKKILGGLRIVGQPWLNRPLAALTPQVIDKRLCAIRDGCEGQEARPWASARHFDYLTTFFKWASKPAVALVESSPMDGVDRPFQDTERKKKQVVFTSEELAAIWNACDELNPVEGAYLRFLLLSGKRKEVQAQMRHEEIKNGVWYPFQCPRATRVKKRHPVALTPTLMAIIAEVESTEGYVFPGGTGGGHFAACQWSQSRVRRISGVEQFHYHALRHTIETRLGELGIDTELRDLMMDHAPKRGTGRVYDHADRLADLWPVLETWRRYLEAVQNPVQRQAIDKVLHPSSLDPASVSARQRLRRAIQDGDQEWAAYLAEIVTPKAAAA